MNDRIIKVIVAIYSLIIVLLMAVIFVSVGLYFDISDQTKQMNRTPTSANSAICNGVKIKFKTLKIDDAVIQNILTTVGALEGNYNPKNGLMFVPLKYKCDRLSAIFAANSLRNIPEIDYSTPIILSP
jgi:hypothetical protein